MSTPAALERPAAAAALLSALAALLSFALARATGLLAVAALVPLHLFGGALAALVFARLRLARLAEEERQAEELARSERPSESLFREGEADEGEPFTLARSRRQFERFVVPWVAPLLATLQAFAAWRVWQALQRPEPEHAASVLMAAAFMAGTAFLFFVAGRYLLGLSRLPQYRLLRAPGIYMGMNALGALLLAVTALAVETGWPNLDRLAAWLFLVCYGLLAGENLLAAIAGLYQRSVPGKAPVSTYESRLGALLTDPAAWVRNVAQALDYQFGFQVSHTWFYRFLQSALLPLLFFQLLALYLLSCLVFLEPHEEGILERWGRAVPAEQGGHLTSGLHLKAPWPFETVRRYPTRRLRTVHIGFEQAYQAGEIVNLLWTVPHHAVREKIVTASRETLAADPDDSLAVPVSFLSIHMPLQYYVTNVYLYAYTYSDPDALIAKVAYRNLTRTAAASDLFDLLGEGQWEMTARLRENIQADINALGLGVYVAFLGLQGAHPPVPVAESFEAVIGALEEKESAILRARAYAHRELPLARAAALTARGAAEAYALQRTLGSAADTYRFQQQRRGYLESPAVFRTDHYLRRLRSALHGTRKYIVAATPDSEVVQFDFTEKISADLFDLTPAVWEGTSP